jgi:hypothetical protein
MGPVYEPAYLCQLKRLQVGRIEVLVAGVFGVSRGLLSLETKARSRMWLGRLDRVKGRQLRVHLAADKRTSAGLGAGLLAAARVIDIGVFRCWCSVLRV